MTTYLRGRYQPTSGGRRRPPLLVQFPFEAGNVIFTSFHNEAQNSETEMELLRYLVFTTVNAQMDANVQRTMVRGGFSPVERNLLSASGSRPGDHAGPTSAAAPDRCSSSWASRTAGRGCD